ncbi:MAG: AAA family ATPase [Candidatus Omnitrophota bacterium]
MTPQRLKIILMYVKLYRLKIIVVVAAIIVLVFAIMGLMSLESFYRNITLAQLPIQILLTVLSAFIFVIMYLKWGTSMMAQLTTKRPRGKFVQVKWSDVIGMEEAKREAWEVVQLIKDRAKVKKIGGKIVRGILMIGPPGCGKTYLAKAIATEAGIPFLAMSGSSFVEIFVGVGASKVRKLFKQARMLAEGYGGCIIFIDELDSIGSNRIFNAFGSQEKDSTQNQMLAEIDGVQEKEQNIIIIGATNADEQYLDPAMLRPGRFDRKLYIDKPNLQDRERIFEYYFSKIKYDKQSIDMKHLAKRAVYKTPAEIENIVKEAALIAARDQREEVSYKHISEAIERIEMGLKHKRYMTPKEKEMVAYHESGHLVVLYLLHPTDDVFKASIVGRREALGVVYHQPREELFTKSRDAFLADIKVSLAGFVAEKVRFGITSSGVASDFWTAMRIAHSMVWELGMNDAGLVGDYTAIPETQLSDHTKETLNNETNKIFQKCLKDVEDLLIKEKVILERFVKELLEKEELDYDEIEKIFQEYGKFHAKDL